MANDVVIKLKNKKTGVVYVYYGQSKYSKDGKCTSKGLRKSIGKYNSQDEFEPNKTFLLMSPEEQLATGLVEEPYYPFKKKDVVEKDDYRDKFYGYTAIIETAAKKTGMYSALRKVFPNDYLAMMSMVEALICFPSRPLYSPNRFHSACWHTNVDILTEGAITSALEEVTPDKREKFFYEFNKERKSEEEMIVALDTTSISTYSAMLNLARYGYNKEHDSLAQINLLMVCDNESGIPLHYRNIPGNSADSVSVKASVENMKSEGVKEGTIFVMDRGFCTLDNMVLILKNGFTFLMCMPEKCAFYHEAIDAVLPTLEDSSNYIPSIRRYCATYDVEVPVVRRGRGKNSYTMTVYVFKDPVKEADEKNKLSRTFVEKLETLKANPSIYANSRPDSFYKKYYIMNADDTFSHNKEAQNKALKECGISLVIGPKGWKPIKVHRTYKQRDVIEKDYENWKVRMRRPRHSIDEHLEGKVFLLFLVTVIEAYIRKKLKDAYLDLDISMEDNMDVIFNARWRKPKDKSFKEGQWIDLTQDQIKMLHLMGVPGMEKLNPNVDNLVKNDILRRQGKAVKRGPKSKKK